MKIIKKAVLTGGIVMFLFSSVWAEAGTTSAVFLKLEQGVRPVSMGGAFTAASDDVNAVYWNPAGLPQVSNLELTFMHTMWFAEIFYDYLGFAYPVGEVGTFGLGLTYVNSGDITSWNEIGEEIGEFSAWDLAVNLAFGTKLNEKTSVGIIAKLFNESIDDRGAFGFAADLGLIHKFRDDLQGGIVLQNLGPKHGFGDAFLLPMNARAGLSYTGVRNMMVNLDYIQPIETNGIIALGMEYWYRDIIVFRLGYQYQGMFDPNKYYENYAGPAIFSGFVIGAGLKIDIYEIDYAYKQFGVLESTHRIGLTLKFK